jgi:hypothetical protein
MLRNGKRRIKLAALLVYTGLYIHDMLRGDLIFLKYEIKCISLRNFFGIDVLFVNLKI